MKFIFNKANNTPGTNDYVLFLDLFKFLKLDV
jgi:hypothetical protein